jgi:hypothetical protein
MKARALARNEVAPILFFKLLAILIFNYGRIINLSGIRPYFVQSAALIIIFTFDSCLLDSWLPPEINHLSSCNYTSLLNKIIEQLSVPIPIMITC